jgi:hypothetical protein
VEQSIEGVDWKAFRVLWAAEKDLEVKGALQRIEQLARNIESEKRNRAGWNRIRGNNAIRETLWKSRRLK